MAVKKVTPKKPAAIKKPTPTPLSTAEVNLNSYRTTSASVNDISKKYGIDYSREYAQRQAEAAAQAKRTGLQTQLKQTDTGVRNASDAIDKSYFQKGLQQAQSNVNGGVNAGLANETNLRLGMNRQAEIADMQREAQTARQGINQQLTDVETARVAQEEQMYQERMQQAIALIQQDRSLDQNEKQALLNAAIQQRGQNLDKAQFDKQLDWDKYQFNNVNATDKMQIDWSKYQFNNMSATDKGQLDWSKYQFNNMSAADRANLDWGKYQFNNLSAADQAANKLAYDQLKEEKRQFGTEQKWREYQYKHMSASEKAQFEEDKRQFGTEMAWRREELRITGLQAQQIAETEADGVAGDWQSFLP